MPTFSYTAKAMDGSTIKSTMDAASEDKLNEHLRADGLFLLSCKEKKVDPRKLKIKALELSDFCRQIGTMLGSGVSLLRAVEIVSQRDIPPRLKAIYQRLVGHLQQGESLSEAMTAESPAFPSLLVHMFAAGEASGRMEQTALKMANHYEKEHRLKMRIVSAAAYPIILLCITILVMIIIFTFVLPQFLDIYEGTTLPMVTRIVMAVSGFVTGHWFYLIFGVVALVLIIRSLLAMPKIRHAFDKSKLQIPILGKLLRIIYTARFARTLSSLYASGLSMIDALAVSRETIGNTYIAGQFDEALDKIREGVTLSGSIGAIDGFDVKLASTIMIGEETGRLDEMLESAADSFDYEADIATQKLTSILEPLLIVIMAVIVATIMFAVLLPIYDMYNSMNTY